jgi:hypothetical protein
VGIGPLGALPSRVALIYLAAEVVCCMPGTLMYLGTEAAPGITATGVPVLNAAAGGACGAPGGGGPGDGGCTRQRTLGMGEQPTLGEYLGRKCGARPRAFFGLCVEGERGRGASVRFMQKCVRSPRAQKAG